MNMDIMGGYLIGLFVGAFTVFYLATTIFYCKRDHGCPCPGKHGPLTGTKKGRYSYTWVHKTDGKEIHPLPLGQTCNCNREHVTYDPGD